MVTFEDLEGIITSDNMFVMNRLTALTQPTLKATIEALVAGNIIPSDIIHLESITEASINDLLLKKRRYEFSIPISGASTLYNNYIDIDWLNTPTPYSNLVSYKAVDITVSKVQQDTPLFTDVATMASEMRSIYNTELPVALGLGSMTDVLTNLVKPELFNVNSSLYSKVIELIEQIGIDDALSSPDNMYQLWIDSNVGFSIFTENSNFMNLFLNSKYPVANVKDHFTRAIRSATTGNLNLAEQTNEILTEFEANSSINELLTVIMINLTIIETEELDDSELLYPLANIKEDNQKIVDYLNFIRNVVIELYTITRTYIY